MSKPAQADASIAVVVPTRSRPGKLRRCLDSMMAAQDRLGFPAHVCDSSPKEDDRDAVHEVCAAYPWVELNFHRGSNVAAARNACARAATEDLLINIDDDLQLEPEAIDRLLARYRQGTGRRIVAGSVSLDGVWSAPVKKRAIGYGRPALEDEEADFVIGALFLYPRRFALAWPWNERIDTMDDFFMGALWRSHGVKLLFAEDARGLHPDLPLSLDPSRLDETVEHQGWHIYSLLFDALIANPNPRRALAYEVLGFAAGAKLFFRRPALAHRFVRSWMAGHRRLLADRGYLKELVDKEIPEDAT